MSLLERLPTEIFHSITNYLAYLDKKALSTTSKQCHALIGYLPCSNAFSWIAHICRIPPTNIDNDPILLRSSFVLNHFKEASGKLIFDAHWKLHDRSLHWRGDDHVHFKRYDHPIELLLLPYFKQPFPRSTLVHFYYRCIHKYAAEAIPVLGGVLDRKGPYLESLRTWRSIEQGSRQELEWLARRKPVSKYLEG